MTQFTPSERAQFVAIADILICGDDIMPAASQADIADERLDRLLEVPGRSTMLAVLRRDDSQDSLQ